MMRYTNDNLILTTAEFIDEIGLQEGDRLDLDDVFHHLRLSGDDEELLILATEDGPFTQIADDAAVTLDSGIVAIVSGDGAIVIRVDPESLIVARSQRSSCIGGDEEFPRLAAA